MVHYSKFLQIMAFYASLSCVIFPAIFYYMFGKSFQQAGNGFVIGSIISIILWYVVGSKMV